MNLTALGPASYVVTAFDLHPIHKGNCIFKFADDTYLIVPCVNTNTSGEEVLSGFLAADNNLTLNRGKTKELVLTANAKTALFCRRSDPSSSACPACKSSALSSTTS